MIAPATAAICWLRTLAVGGVLGLVYGFLRPLRKKCTHLADGIFGLAVFWGWVYTLFAICGGDSRISCTLTLFLGIWAWDATAGRLLRPLFDMIWHGVGQLGRGAWLPVKKIIHYFPKIYNFLLEKWKKWVTIEGTITKAGGNDHGKTPCQVGSSKNQPCHQSRSVGRRRPVRGGHRRPV